MLKFQTFLLVCLPIIAKAAVIPANNDISAIISSVQVQALAADLIITCTTGYTAVEGSCYLFQTPPATFEIAEWRCEMTGGFLALPDISVANDAFGINIAGAFPESTTNPFFIGVRSTDDDAGSFILRDLDENIIENTNPRFDATNPTSTVENIGVFVTIPASNFGGWTTTLAVDDGATIAEDVTMAFLCQTNPI